MANAGAAGWTEVRSCVLALAMGLAASAGAGCTINRVTVLSREAAGAPGKLQASDVRVVPDFRALPVPHRVDGALSAYTLPTGANTADKREALLKDTAAALGADALVGLQSLAGRGHPGLTSAVLVRTGAAPSAPPPPRFLVVVPPAAFQADPDPSVEKLDDFVREVAQYFMAYIKGYYGYRRDLPGLSHADILRGALDPAGLAGPLGAAPDYALLCNASHREWGTAAIYRTRSMDLVLTLYDLREKRVVWTGKASAEFSQGVLVNILTLRDWWAALLDSDDYLLAVRAAVREAIDSMPAVPGLRPGALSPMDSR